MAYQVRLKAPLPAGMDVRTTKIVIGGAGRGAPGNKAIMDMLKAAVYGSLLEANVTEELVTNGIVVSRILYNFVDEVILDNAPYRTKEELVCMIEKGVIEVFDDGVVLTAAQVRAL